MEKNIFTQIDPEDFEYSKYYDKEEAENDKAWFGGNSELISMNSELRRDVVIALGSIHYAVTCDNFCKKEAVSTYMIRRMSGKAYNKNDVTKIWRLAEDYYTCRCDEEDKIICEALEMIYGKTFICGAIRGCSQGEWLNYIMPKELEDNIDYIEAVLFNKGTEFVDEQNSTWFSASVSTDDIKKRFG